VSAENSVKLAGDQLNEAGTAAQTRATLREANRFSFFMVFSQELGACFFEIKLNGLFWGRAGLLG